MLAAVSGVAQVIRSAKARDPEEVTLQLAPIAFVGMGAEVDGRMLRSKLVITHDDDDAKGEPHLTVHHLRLGFASRTH
jgi:hypothetical protein